MILTSEEPTYDSDEIPDDRLRLIFTCCLLESLQPSPIVSLNRVVAIAIVEGASAALGLVDALAPNSTRLSPVPCPRADLLRRVGALESDALSYTRALTLVATAKLIFGASAVRSSALVVCLAMARRAYVLATTIENLSFTTHERSRRFIAAF